MNLALNDNEIQNFNAIRRLSIILAGTILGSSFLLIFLADFVSSSESLILAGKNDTFLFFKINNVSTPDS